MTRESYTDNMGVIDSTLQRLERNEVTMDEMVETAEAFAQATTFCSSRLDMIEESVKKIFAKPEA